MSKNNFDLNIKNKYGNTLLMNALYEKKYKIN